MSVIEPAPWLPAIGTPLMAAMSTAVPVECSDVASAADVDRPGDLTAYRDRD